VRNVREVLVALGAALRGDSSREAGRARREHAVTEARSQARQSQADLARARAAARDLSGLSNSRVAGELARRLSGN